MEHVLANRYILINLIERFLYSIINNDCKKSDLKNRTKYYQEKVYKTWESILLVQKIYEYIVQKWIYFDLGSHWPSYSP